LHDQSTVGNELLYASREWDPETNLYYLRARHYDPDTGRFLQEDPVVSINQYAYADNTPILLTDPLGLKPWAGANFIGGFASGLLWGYEGIGRSYYEQCSKAYQYGQMAGMAWWFALGPASAIDAAVARGATVWGSVTATQPVYEGTVLPRSFKLATEAGDFWVHGNATKHMAEHAIGNLERGVSRELVNLGTQAQLTSLKAAVQEAAKQGIQYGRMVKVGEWRLIFNAPRQPGMLPAITHGLTIP